MCPPAHPRAETGIRPDRSRTLSIVPRPQSCSAHASTRAVGARPGAGRGCVAAAAGRLQPGSRGPAPPPRAAPCCAHLDEPCGQRAVQAAKALGGGGAGGVLELFHAVPLALHHGTLVSQHGGTSEEQMAPAPAGQRPRQQIQRTGWKTLPPSKLCQGVSRSACCRVPNLRPGSLSCMAWRRRQGRGGAQCARARSRG